MASYDEAAAHHLERFLEDANPPDFQTRIKPLLKSALHTLADLADRFGFAVDEVLEPGAGPVWTFRHPARARTLELRVSGDGIAARWVSEHGEIVSEEFGARWEYDRVNRVLVPEGSEPTLAAEFARALAGRFSPT
ncbi:MAG: hypothetical protein JRJ84_24100 [Deltaproteobacteria bacterium]|nr:hypothetical protein [Deltaproteobacteria bacterium]